MSILPAGGSSGFPLSLYSTRPGRMWHPPCLRPLAAPSLGGTDLAPVWGERRGAGGAGGRSGVSSEGRRRRRRNGGSHVETRLDAFPPACGVAVAARERGVADQYQHDLPDELQPPRLVPGPQVG